MSKTKVKDTRTRNWTCIVYPESMPENWQEIITGYHIEWIMSPLHDKDLNANGELKKPHYHLLLMFGSVKSYEQVKEITDRLNAPIPERCHNAKSMVRYMAHLDNPEKAQYKQEDIKAFGGVDLASLLKPTSSEKYTLIREMFDYIRENEIDEYKDFVDYCMTERFDDWFPLVCESCTYVISQYIKSLRLKKYTALQRVDLETGEIS